MSADHGAASLDAQFDSIAAQEPHLHSMFGDDGSPEERPAIVGCRDRDLICQDSPGDSLRHAAANFCNLVVYSNA